MYPHRISLIDINNVCDMCQEKMNTLPIRINNTYIGYYVCDEINCKKKMEKIILENTIHIEMLRAKYTEPLKILRSNNVLDNGWKINSNGIKEDAETIWIELKKENMTKNVMLSEIEKLNIQ